MADGLSALHGRNVVHRDFKPGNIFVIEHTDGRIEVKITDFGLARQTFGGEEGGSRDSRSLGPIGTLRYMAPEQIDPDRGEIGPSTDVFAFGIVLYEMLTGANPFPAASLAGNLKEKTEGKPPQTLTAGIDKKWNQTILACLAPEPKDRPQSAGEVLEMLEGRVAPPIPWPQWARIAAAAIFFLAASWAGYRLLVVESPKQLKVAVLPANALGGDEELQGAAIRLTEIVTMRISEHRIPDGELLVALASEVRRLNVVVAADALDNFGSNYAVQSIIQEQDGLTEVSLSIIDTEALNQVDSVTVRGSAEDTLALYDQSVAAVVKMLDELSRPEPLAPRAYEAYRRGIDHLRRFDVEGNPERAVEAFEEALSIDPYNPPAYAGLAEAFLRLDDREPDSPWLARAQENAERAVELDNRLAYARVTLGIIRHRLGDREGAAEQLEKAITLNPQYADAHRELARVYQSLGKTGKAEQEFARVVPRDWRFFLSRGVFYFGQGRYGDAALDFESVIKENPDSHLAFRNLGGVYIMMGRYSEASAALQNAITIRQEARSYSNLGVSLYYQGEFRDAAESFSRAIQEGAGRHIVYGNLGDAQHWAGETGKAVGSFKKAIEVGTRTLDQQENEITRVQIAAYQAKLGACDSARATLPELEKSKRDDLTVQARSALALGLCGQTNAAFDLLGQAIEGGYSRAEIEYDPWFTGLRSSDRFQTLVTEHRQSR